MQLRVCLVDFLSKLSPKTRVEVFVTDLQPDLIRNLAASVDRNFSQQELGQAFNNLFKQAGRQKPEVDQLLRLLQPFFGGKQNNTRTHHMQSILVLWCKSVETYYKIII